MPDPAVTGGAGEDREGRVQGKTRARTARRGRFVVAWLLIAIGAIAIGTSAAPVSAATGTVTVVLTGNGTGTLYSTNASYVADGIIACHREGGVTSGTCSYAYTTPITVYWRQNPAPGSNACSSSQGCHGVYITGYHAISSTGYTINASFELKPTTPAPSTKPSTPKPSTPKPSTPKPATPKPPTAPPVVTAEPGSSPAATLAPAESAAPGDSSAPASAGTVESLAPGQTAAPSTLPGGAGSPTGSSGPSPIILAVLFAGLMLAIAIAFLGWQLGRRRT